MKDLDFDELDRAVNSLMTNVPKSSPSPSDDKEKTLDITPTLDEGSKPEFNKVEKAAVAAMDSPSAATAQQPTLAQTASRPQPSSVSLPAARRGGRFMDVVHPSSDMKKPEMPTPVSRQGSTIEPLKSSPISEIIASKQDASVPASVEPPKEPLPTIKPVDGPAPAMESSETPTDWPDPIDLVSVSTPEKKEEEAPVAEPADSSALTQPEEEAPAPLTSPFLPDTKVEKRPLGSPDVPVEESELFAPAEEKESKTVNDPNDQLPADPTEVEPLLPEELQGDLMAVEADTTHEQVKRAHEATEEPKPLEKNEKIATSSPSPATDKPSASEPATPSGPTSIPQQYHEEASTGDQGNGAIYDTDSYHQPLAHPAKKKSGWMWIIWIVLILLLGAGGGAALYFLGAI